MTCSPVLDARQFYQWTAALTLNHRQSGLTYGRHAGPVKGGKTIIAFVEDPNGYKVELIETASRHI